MSDDNKKSKGAYFREVADCVPPSAVDNCSISSVYAFNNPIMTQTEKLALRLSQFPNRLVRVLAFVDMSGALVFWVIDEDHKIEGANGKPLPPHEVQFEQKESEKE